VGLAALSGWIIIILSIATSHYRDSYHHALGKQHELAQLVETRQKPSLICRPDSALWRILMQNIQES